jgi:hypothetical protein
MRHAMRIMLLLTLAVGCSDGGSEGNTGFVNNGQNNGANNGQNNGANNGQNNGANNGQAVRRLVMDGLMGDLPVDNRVIDPEFAAADFDTGRLRYWYGVQPRGAEVFGARVNTWFSKLTPTRTNALRLSADDLVEDPTIYGFVKTGPAQHEATVWIGRKADAADVDQDSVTVAILGFNPNNDEVRTAFDFTKVDGSRTELDGRVWHQYEGGWRSWLAGWSYFEIHDTAREDLYVAGPVVRDLAGDSKPGAVTERGRTWTPRETAEIGHLDRLRRARHGVQPAKPVIPRPPR